MKYHGLHPVMILIVCALSFAAGYTVNQPDEMELGRIRGGPQTGFSLYAGEQIGIGTTTSDYDIEIYSISTSTIRLSTDQTGTSTGGCLIIADVDRSGYTFCNYNNGSQTCSSTDICK